MIVGLVVVRNRMSTAARGDVDGRDRCWCSGGDVFLVVVRCRVPTHRISVSNSEKLPRQRAGF